MKGLSLLSGEGRSDVEMRKGGWKQNRTALTTERKDKERIGLADRRGCSGALSCYMKGDGKRAASARGSQRRTQATDTSPSALSTVRNNRLI